MATATPSTTLVVAEPSLTTQMPTNPTSCPNCGSDLPAPAPAPASSEYPSEAAQQRIHELEAQVKLLNEKASSTADKLADYEDEVQNLRSKVQKLSQSTPVATEEDGRPKTAAGAVAVATTTPTLTRLGSLSSVFSRRKLSDNNNNINNNSNQQTPTAVTSPPTTTTTTNTSASTSSGLGIGFLLNQTQSNSNSNSNTAAALHQQSPSGNHVLSPLSGVLVAEPGSVNTDPMLQTLQAQLENERNLRQQAEASLHASQLEIEELTSQLFGEANEMVAQERQERAKVEQRLKVLQDREQRRAETLDKLEARIRRVDRVRGLVGP